jgi:hypothetical protein
MTRGRPGPEASTLQTQSRHRQEYHPELIYYPDMAVTCIDRYLRVAPARQDVVYQRTFNLQTAPSQDINQPLTHTLTPGYIKPQV